MRLREVFDRHGCDKGRRHAYERLYETVFEPLREQPLSLLEIGVYRGASLMAWLEYLPNAALVAVDTFQRVAPEQVPVLNHPRVRWFRADSTRGVPTHVPMVEFIIDDGCHAESAQRATLKHFWSRLKGGGRYFIEDAPGLMVPGATVHDLRRGGATDSVIVEVRG